MTKKKYEQPLHIDMPFDEALERFAGVDPKEMQANIDKEKKKKPPEAEASGGPVVHLRDKRKWNNI